MLNIKRFIHVSTDEVYGEQRLDQEAMVEEQVIFSSLAFFEHILAFIVRRGRK